MSVCDDCKFKNDCPLHEDYMWETRDRAESCPEKLKQSSVCDDCKFKNNCPINEEYRDYIRYYEDVCPKKEVKK